MAYNQLPDSLKQLVADGIKEGADEYLFKQLNMNPESNIILGYKMGVQRREEIADWLLSNSDSSCYSWKESKPIIGRPQHVLWITDSTLATLFKLTWA